MSIPIQNIYYLLCYAWNKLDEKEKVSVDLDDDTKLVDLFAKLLISSSSMLLKRGLEHNYIPVTEERVGVRGKLEVSASIKANSFQHLKAICSFDEYSGDILHNQILVTTLYRLLYTKNLDSTLKEKIRKPLRMFPPIQVIELNPAVFQKVRIHRNNRFYEFILNICRMVYDYSLPTESKGEWLFTDFTRDEKRMAYLFENFVYRFYKIEAPHLKAKRDHIRWNFHADNPANEQYLPLMKTDITLSGASPKIIIDTKYSQDTMRESYDKETVKSENLYQLFSYLLNQEDGSVETAKAKGILLYPTIDQEYNLHYRYREHEIQIKTVNLNTHWSEIEKRLLQVVDENY